MILFRLFYEFFKIGLFSFGGAYGAIPVIRDGALRHGWITEEMFENVVAVSESTPGPIMVNAATYIGSSQAGIPGAAAATLGVVLPSFLIILLTAMFLRGWLKNVRVQAALSGIKPAVAGIILGTGLWMALSGMVVVRGCPLSLDYRMLILIAALCLIKLFWNRRKRRELSPIALIVIAALMGMIAYG